MILYSYCSNYENTGNYYRYGAGIGISIGTGEPAKAGKQGKRGEKVYDGEGDSYHLREEPTS